MKSDPGILLETDVMAEYLLSADGDSIPLFRRLLETLTCYITFIQAAELYGVAGNDDEMRTIDRALYGTKVLGASSRYAKTMGTLLSSSGATINHRTAIVAAIAITSGLPIVTDLYYQQYRTVPGLHVVRASDVQHESGPEQLRTMIYNGA